MQSEDDNKTHVYIFQVHDENKWNSIHMFCTRYSQMHSTWVKENSIIALKQLPKLRRNPAQS